MKRIDVVLVAGGKWHDIDFARLEILKLLGTDERVRVRVFEDYESIAALRGAQSLVTYTCDVVPSLAAQEALRRWLEQGGRWYALHGSNTILRYLSGAIGDADDPLRFAVPDLAPHFAETLGSLFISHPPYRRYRVEVADGAHPLTRGLQPFETEDEQYLFDLRGPARTLLHARHAGPAGAQFPPIDLADAFYPVLYLKDWGKGGVLYNALGHCRGRHDMQPLLEEATPQRGSWDTPEFREVLARGLTWAKGDL
jgi:hypothetical protein